MSDDNKTPQDTTPGDHKDVKDGKDSTLPGDDKKDAPKDGDTKVVDGKDSKEGKDVLAAPDKYDLKLSDGSLLKPENVNAITEFAKSNKLSNEQAQAVLDRENANFAAYVDAQKKQVVEEQQAWIKEAKEDEEIGGDNLGKNMELSKRLIAKYGPEGFAKELEDSGYGNYPNLIKFIVRIIKANNFAEDTLVSPNASGSGKKSLEEVFYGASGAKS